MQLKLTKTEALIIDALRKWPLTKYQLEDKIDSEKFFWEKAISVHVNRINGKRKIITLPSQWDWTHYELTESNVDYQIMNWLEEVKFLICATCPHKDKWKINLIFWWMYFILWSILATIACLLIMEVEVEFNIIQDCKNNIISIEPTNLKE